MSSLLPPNASPLERALAAGAAMAHEPERIAALWDAATCPPALLPWLAWALSVDVWDDAWGEAAQRAAVAGSIAWHRKKGTPWAVKQALAGAGFANTTIVEHAALYQAWLAAGGETLNGDGLIDGSGTLAPPAGDWRFATTHWAQYALRLNIGDEPWQASRQREIKAICAAYGPARAHLAAIILASLYTFDSTVRIAGVQARARSVWNNCRRVTATRFDTLDGCDLIGGQDLPDWIDGAGTLDGLGAINGTRPTGEPLDGGQLGITTRARQTIAMGAALGGDRAEPPELLWDAAPLDGRYTIAGSLLDGIDLLDGAGTLDYPTLATPDDCLDGTSRLGAMPGMAGPWASGRWRATLRGQVTTGVLQ